MMVQASYTYATLECLPGIRSGSIDVSELMMGEVYIFATCGTSVCKSSYKIGKRLRLDQTTTDQDRKFARPIKTVTMVWSSVLYHLGS